MSEKEMTPAELAKANAELAAKVKSLKFKNRVKNGLLGGMGLLFVVVAIYNAGGDFLFLDGFTGAPSIGAAIGVIKADSQATAYRGKYKPLWKNRPMGI